VKTFTPTQVKADVQFVVSVAIALGFNLPTALGATLIGASALIAVGLNLAEAHIHVGSKLAATFEQVSKDIKSVLPAINELVATLPGKIGEEVKRVLELVEKGPSTETKTGPTKTVIKS
jgi:hypothetical protein